MKLALNHVAHSRIVTARDCDPVTRYAAEELAHFLGEISGCAFRIVNDKQEPQKQDILVGLSKRTAHYADRMDYTEYGELLLQRFREKMKL